MVLVSEAIQNARLPPSCSVERCDFTSHHYRVNVGITVPRAKSKALYRTGRAWKTFDGDAFLTDVAVTDWNSVVNADDNCDRQWEVFVSSVNGLLNVHAPMRRYRVHNLANPPVSLETLDLMAQRRRAKECNDPSYQHLNIVTKRAIRTDCRENLTQRIKNAAPSDLYRQLRPVIAPKRGPTTEPSNLMADELNQYFTSIGLETRDKVAEDFRRSNRESLKQRLPRVNTGKLRISPVSFSELEKALFSMPNKVSCIEGDIPVKILKLCFPINGQYLLRIINNSFASGVVPASWKRAIVIPLYKKGDPSVASNFRPVTNIPTITKIVEKLASQQLTDYLNREHLYSDDQHGFRAHHSTCTALLSVTDEILKGMDRSEITLLTLIDLSRCFDVVDHKTLLNKLESLQICPKWFENYLGGHIQQVKLGETLSDPLPINIGTFQGTCLGPLLFNIASNDLPCHIPDEINGFRIIKVRYADDSQIGIIGPRSRLNEMQKSIEEVLETMTTWFQQNGMLVNASKTEFIVCGDRRQLTRLKSYPTINFMGEILHSKKDVKNLGITMDCCLNWEQHVKQIADRCYGILVALLRAKQVLPVETLPKLIDAMVFSHVRYCIQVYGGTSATNVGKIQKIFNFAARVISGRKKFDHISDILKQYEWLSAEQCIEYFDLCLLHKTITVGEPAMLSNQFIFNRDAVERHTRQSDLLALPRPRTNHGKRNYVYRSSSLFNSYFRSNNASDFLSTTSNAAKKWIREVCASPEHDKRE